jgi:hypothetical protein
MTRIRTSDGCVMEIKPEFIQDCSRLKMVTEMTDSCDFEMLEIPLNIDATTLETIVRFFETGTVHEFQESVWNAAQSLGYDKLLNTRESPAEFVQALACNCWANNENMTLEDVYANTLQDGQYTAFARRNAQILAKYLAKYGKMTIKQIRDST